jgi:hypothetical protein
MRKHDTALKTSRDLLTVKGGNSFKGKNTCNSLVYGFKHF